MTLHCRRYISHRIAPVLLAVVTLLVNVRVADAQLQIVKKSAVAQNAAPTAALDKWALVIAVDRNRGVNRDDQFADDQARSLVSILKDTYGYQSDRVVELIGGDANFKRILRSMQELAERIPRTASLLIYVSASGVTGPYGDAYVLPHDGKVEEKWTLVPVSDLARLARQTQATLIVSDNCALGSSLVAEAGSRRPRGSRSSLNSVKAVQIQKQMPQQTQRVASESDDVLNTTGEFDVVGLCPSGERPVMLTRSLALRADPRRSSEHVQAFLQGVMGRAAGADRTVTARNLVEYMDHSGLALNGEVQYVTGLGSMTFVLSPETETRYSALRETAVSVTAGVYDRTRAIASLSAIATKEGGDQYRADLGSILQGILLDPDQPTDVRSAALDALKEAGSSYSWGLQTARTVVQQDVDLKLRIKALGYVFFNSGDPEAREIVREALGNDRAEVRALAIEMSAKARDQAAAGALVQIAVNDPVMSVRNAAIGALPAIQSDPNAAAAALIPLLDDPDTYLQVQALNALVQTESPAATEAIGGVVVDQEKQTYVRQSAAYALGKIVSPQNKDMVVEILASVLDRGQADAIREAAVFSLGQAGRGGHEELLIEIIMEPSEDSEVRVAAARALGTMGAASALEPFMMIVEDVEASTRLRVASIEAISQIDDPVGARFLYSVLEYGDSRLRDAAASAVGRIRVEAESPDLVLKLITFLGDKNYEIRESAVESLTGMTDEVTFQILVDNLYDKQQLVRRGVVEVFGRQRLPRAFDLVVEMTMDPSFDVRIAAYDALGRFDGLEGHQEEARREILLEGIYDREPAVKRAALNTVRATVVGFSFEGRLDEARELASQAAERVNDDDEASAWFDLVLLPNEIEAPTAAVEINAPSIERSSGPGWQSVTVTAGDRVVTTYGNTSSRDLFVTSVALSVDGQVDLPMLNQWIAAGDRADVAGVADIEVDGSSGVVLRTFAATDGAWDPGRPNLESTSHLRDYLLRAIRSGAIRSAGIVTARVMPRPRADYLQMKR